MIGLGALVGSLVGAAAIGGGRGGRTRRYRHPSADPVPEVHLAWHWKVFVVFGGLGGLVGLVGFPVLRFVSPWLPPRTRHRKQTLMQQALDLVAVVAAGGLALAIMVGGFVALFRLALRLLE